MLKEPYIFLEEPQLLSKETYISCYGVAMVSRLLKMIGLFCRISFFIELFCKRDL